MVIILSKDFINNVRKDINKNPDREIGYIYKPDNTYERIIGESMRVKFSKNLLTGIEIHTHPVHNLRFYNDPPSDIDLMMSYNHYKKNDAVVFDKSGIWIYRANNEFLSLDKSVVSKELLNLITKKIRFFHELLILNKISIKDYIKNMRNLVIYAVFNITIGFIIKYYSYDDLEKIENIKLNYIKPKFIYLKLDKKFLESTKRDLFKNKDKEIGMYLTPDYTLHQALADNKYVNLHKKNKIIKIYTHMYNEFDKNTNYNPPKVNDYIEFFKLNLYNNDSVIFDKSGIWIFRLKNDIFDLNQEKKINNKYKQDLTKTIKVNNKNLIDNNINIQKYIKNLSNNFYIKYYHYIDLEKIEFLNVRYYEK